MVAPLPTVATTCRRQRREVVGRGGAAVADKRYGNGRQGRVERRVVGRDIVSSVSFPIDLVISLSLTRTISLFKHTLKMLRHQSEPIMTTI